MRATSWRERRSCQGGFDLALNMCLVVERMLSFSKRAVYLHLVLAATSGLCILTRLEFRW